MIGILPAAGAATRMLRLPKMLLPVHPGTTLIERMHDQMRSATPRKVLIGTMGLTMALLERDDWFYTRLYHAYTRTMSETVLVAKQFTTPGEIVLFGMPDTYLEDTQAFVKLKLTLEQGADVAVGVFKTRAEQRSKLGMVKLFGGRVEAVVDKPGETDLTYAWGVMAWKAPFWEHIQPDDPHIGFALPRAIAAGGDVSAVYMNGGYWDCGTPDEYFALIAHLQGGRRD